VAERKKNSEMNRKRSSSIGGVLGSAARDVSYVMSSILAGRPTTTLSGMGGHGGGLITINVTTPAGKENQLRGEGQTVRTQYKNRGFSLDGMGGDEGLSLSAACTLQNL